MTEYLFNPATRLVDRQYVQYSDGSSWSDLSNKEIFIPAQHFNTFAGSGALTAVGSIIPGWDLDTTADETLATALMLPDSWVAFNASVVWSNASTGAGGVRWDVVYGFPAIGAVPGSGTTASATATASTTQYLSVSTAVVTSGICVPDCVAWFKVNRDADHAGDTLANDARFHGLLLSRV